MKRRRAVAKPVASMAATSGSPWSPFRHSAFTVLWTATLVSNVGGWMYSAASGWLMTSLDPDPFTVSLVQVATSLPMFLFALPAGALADIVDRRRFLIGVEILITAISAVFAYLVWIGDVTPVTLLVFTFLAGVAGALEAPAWQAIVPALVTKRDLLPAIVANGVNFNISRVIGPALGGIIVGAWGIVWPFGINAVSNIGVIAGMIWWRSPQKPAWRLPAERFVNANRLGLRYARNNPHLRATLIRVVGFFLFASAYWALLPLVARNQIAGGPELYGALLGAIGGGALIGAFVLPWLRQRLGPDLLAAAGTAGTALAMTLYGLARDPATALAACLIAGISWIAVLSALNVSAQVALPEWVRARGLALYVTVMFGALSVGSVIWGKLGGVLGLPAAHYIAAAGMLLTLAFTGRWKLQTALGIDLAPSMHWSAPVTTHDIDLDSGPVLVSVEYRIDPKNRARFLAALETLGQERRRDGAYRWRVFEDAAEEGRIVETFLVESWLEHLRQHRRVTNADRVVQNAVWRFHVKGTPKVTHLIAADRNRPLKRKKRVRRG
ncbi:MAG: MFS transporter [Stellaceae bacterium]